MLNVNKSQLSGADLPTRIDVTIDELLSLLADHPSARLTFTRGGEPLRASYHVTEVKSAQFSALDCGANFETWQEVFIQLWDVDDSPEQMTAGKFSAIIRKVSAQAPFDRDARLTFEVSDGVHPMQLFCAGEPQLVQNEFLVALVPRAASCKPRDRWLDASAPTACCGSSSGTKCCS